MGEGQREEGRKKNRKAALVDWRLLSLPFPVYLGLEGNTETFLVL